MLKGGNFGKTLVAVSEDPTREERPRSGYVTERVTRG
jgi:hypothetical protein